MQSVPGLLRDGRQQLCPPIPAQLYGISKRPVAIMANVAISGVAVSGVNEPLLRKTALCVGRNK
jgi:hypothetical protein